MFRLDNWIKCAGYRVDRKIDLAYEAPANDEQPEELQTKGRVLAIAYTGALRYAVVRKLVTSYTANKLHALVHVHLTLH